MKLLLDVFQRMRQGRWGEGRHERSGEDGTSQDLHDITCVADSTETGPLDCRGPSARSVVLHPVA